MASRDHRLMSCEIIQLAVCRYCYIMVTIWDEARLLHEEVQAVGSKTGRLRHPSPLCLTLDNATEREHEGRPHGVVVGT